MVFVRPWLLVWLGFGPMTYLGSIFLKYLLSTFLAFIENFLDDPVKENLLFIGYHIISGVPGKSC